MMPPGRSRLTGLACLVLLAAVLSPWSARTAMPAENPPAPAARENRTGFPSIPSAGRVTREIQRHPGIAACAAFVYKFFTQL